MMRLGRFYDGLQNFVRDLLHNIIEVFACKDYKWQAGFFLMKKVGKAIAAPNIALLKYWGKRDDLLKLPLNDSVSITLDEKALRSKARLEIFDEKGADEVWLNKRKVEDMKINEWLMLVRKRLCKKYPVVKNKIKIYSENNFPTSAGIASSASGFCALATALCGCLGIENGKEMSILARLGSGSASRSVYGGIVRWKKGGLKSGEDSYAVQIVDNKYWKGICDVIAIVDEGAKKTSSKEGMERTSKTSPLMKKRLQEVRGRMLRILRAIKKMDFASLAKETMADSDSMHAVAAAAKPPVIYMNKVSHEIVSAVRKLNGEVRESSRAGRKMNKKIICAYTFDAGPNAHIIVQKKNLGKVKKMLSKIKGVKRIIVSGIGIGSRLA
jgi:diphosphomevalonate decarboxylase